MSRLPHFPVPDFATWKPATELPKGNVKILVMVSGPEGMQAEIWDTDRFRQMVLTVGDPERFYFVELRNIIPYQLKHPKKGA